VASNVQVQSKFLGKLKTRVGKRILSNKITNVCPPWPETLQASLVLTSYELKPLLDSWKQKTRSRPWATIPVPQVFWLSITA